MNSSAFHTNVVRSYSRSKPMSIAYIGHRLNRYGLLYEACASMYNELQARARMQRSYYMR